MGETRKVIPHEKNNYVIIIAPGDAAEAPEAGSVAAALPPNAIGTHPVQVQSIVRDSPTALKV